MTRTLPHMSIATAAPGKRSPLASGAFARPDRTPMTIIHSIPWGTDTR
jgi:hypothetical protein